MATVTITLTDTPEGAVELDMDLGLPEDQAGGIMTLSQVYALGVSGLFPTETLFAAGSLVIFLGNGHLALPTDMSPSEFLAGMIDTRAALAEIEAVAKLVADEAPESE